MYFDGDILSTYNCLEFEENYKSKCLKLFQSLKKCFEIFTFSLDIIPLKSFSYILTQNQLFLTL